LWNDKVGINAGSLIDKALKGHDYDMDTIKNALSNQIVDEMKKGNMKTTPSDFRNYDDFDFETGVNDGANDRVKDDSSKNTDSGKNKKDNKSYSDNSALKIEIEKDEPMPSTSVPVGYHYEQTPCVGSYEVEGYTRDDGKEVDDYIRTCGAKHWRLVKDTKVDDGITGGAANIDNTETNSSSNTPTDESHSNTDDGKALKGGVEESVDASNIDTESFSSCDNFIQLGKAFSSEFPNLLNSALSDATQLSKGGGDNETKNNLQKTVRALKKSREFQEEVLTHVFKKIDSTKDKTHKEELQKEYSKLKNENIKTVVLVDKIDNDLKNNDYNRVVQDIKEYNQESGIKNVNYKSSEMPQLENINQNSPESNIADKISTQDSSIKSRDTNSTAKQDTSSFLAQLKDKLGIKPTSNQQSIEETENIGKVLSGGNTVNEFIRALGKDINVNSDTIKKVLATYKSSVGKKIEESYKEKVRDGIEKILKEWTDATKAMKLAGEIAEEISPYLTAIDIFVETYEGYNEGGSKEAKHSFYKAVLFTITTITASGILDVAGVAAIPAFAVVLIIEYLLSIVIK